MYSCSCWFGMMWIRDNSRWLAREKKRQNSQLISAAAVTTASQSRSLYKCVYLNVCVVYTMCSGEVFLSLLDTRANVQPLLRPNYEINGDRPLRCVAFVIPTLHSAFGFVHGCVVVGDDVVVGVVVFNIFLLTLALTLAAHRLVVRMEWRSIGVRARIRVGYFHKK